MTSYPSVSFQVEKIIDVVTVEGNIKNFKVQWAPSWVSSLNLFGCERLIKDFLNQRCDEYKCGDNTFTFPMDFSVDRNVNQDYSLSIETTALNEESLPRIVEQASLVSNDLNNVNSSKLFSDSKLKKDLIDSLHEVRVELPNVLDELPGSSLGNEKEVSETISEQTEIGCNNGNDSLHLGKESNDVGHFESEEIVPEDNPIDGNGQNQVVTETSNQDNGSQTQISASIFEKLSTVLDNSTDDIEDSFHDKSPVALKYIKSEELPISNYQYLPKFQPDEASTVLPNNIKDTLFNGQGIQNDKVVGGETSGLKSSIRLENTADADSFQESNPGMMKRKCNYRLPEKRTRTSYKRKEYSIRGRSISTNTNNTEKDNLEKQSNVTPESASEMHSIDCKNMCIEGKYRCIACGITFVNARNFSNHQCFSCPYCKMTFYDKAAFDEHASQHKPSETTAANNDEDTLDCKYCGMSFSNKGRFKKHKCFCCTSCKMIFTTKLIFDKHVLAHNARGSKRKKASINTCSNCGLAFVQGKPFLKKHKCFPCQVCQEVFLTKQLFDEHSLQHADTGNSQDTSDKEAKRKFY